MDYKRSFIEQLNKSINKYINKCFLAKSPCKFVETFVAADTFPETYNECSSACDYLRLKAKEFILKELILQLAIFEDDMAGSYLSTQDAHRYYYDLLDRKYDEVLTTLKDAGFVSDHYYAYVYDDNSDRKKSIALTVHKNTSNDQRKKYYETK